MNAKKFSDAMSELDTKYVDEALNYKKKAKKPIWVKWGAIAACLCLIISGMFLLKHAEYNNIGGSDGIVMLFTEAEVVEVFSPRSALVEITEENIYNANTDKNLFNVGDMVQAEFNEDIVLHFNVGDIVIIGRGNTADVDYSQKPYIAQCNNIQIKAEEDYRNIWVSAANNLGEEAAGHTFVETTYGEYLINLPEDNSCRIEDYKLLDYTPLETTENSVSGEFTFAIKAVNENYYTGQYTLDGTGEYEGWLILRKRFTLEHRNNPYWKCIELEDIEISNIDYSFQSESNYIYLIALLDLLQIQHCCFHYT